MLSGRGRLPCTRGTSIPLEVRMIFQQRTPPKLLFALACLLVSGTCFSQRPPSGPPPGSGGRTSTPSPPPVTQTTPRAPVDNVLFINGRVETDDGTALPSNITVERVCAGQTRQQVHADLRGNFSFDMGMRISEMPDVTVAPGLGSN